MLARALAQRRCVHALGRQTGHAEGMDLAAPVLTPQVASPRLRIISKLTAKPPSTKSTTVGSLRYAGAEYPGSSSLRIQVSNLLHVRTRER